jgi:hypothetical protein
LASPTNAQGVKRRRIEFLQNQRTVQRPGVVRLNQLAVEVEITRYLQLTATVDCEGEEAIDFWLRHKKSFPILFALCRTLFAIAPTSADAERQFSISGQLLRAKRAKTLPVRARKLLFIHANIHVFDTIVEVDEEADE